MSHRGGPAARAVKRAIDLIGAALGLVVTLPVLALAAALIRLEDGPPVFYRQRRAGRDGEFDLLKFRSMRVHDLPVSAVGDVTEGHPLVTRVGRVLRRLKIDELPQLMNVLRGDMSLVGPRPTVPEQVAEYGAFERRRLLVRPGLSGWAQVNGNVRLTWQERIALDVWYVDHWSLTLDVAILFKTLAVVLLGEHPNPRALREALAYADDSDRRG